jgi:Tfp pilus assembly protein PilO
MELFNHNENPIFDLKAKLLIVISAIAFVCGFGYLIYLCIASPSAEDINRKIIALQSSCETKP